MYAFPRVAGTPHRKYFKVHISSLSIVSNTLNVKIIKLDDWRKLNRISEWRLKIWRRIVRWSDGETKVCQVYNMLFTRDVEAFSLDCIRFWPRYTYLSSFSRYCCSIWYKCRFAIWYLYRYTEYVSYDGHCIVSHEDQTIFAPILPPWPLSGCDRYPAAGVESDLQLLKIRLRPVFLDRYGIIIIRVEQYRFVLSP